MGTDAARRPFLGSPRPGNLVSQAGPVLFDVWLLNFTRQHERARAKQLSGSELSAYMASRDELAQALIKTQNLLVQPGQKPRRSLRVAVALPLQLDMPGGMVKTLTRDLSTGGFSAVVPGLLTGVTRGLFALTLVRGEEPLRGKFQVVDASMVGTSCRVGGSFHELPPPDIERIEMHVFDVVLAQMRKSKPPA
jgi:hypothetical protein